VVDYVNDGGFLLGGELNLSRVNYGMMVLIHKLKEVANIR
jgi:hypothetical protein